MLTTNNGETIFSACLHGLGLCLLPDWSVYEALQKGELIRLFPDLETAIHIEPRKIAMLYPNTRYNSLNTKTVIDFFSHIFGENIILAITARFLSFLSSSNLNRKI
ncbi:LysR substrate-binding domain-containing protein [Gallibacterium genomosp. 3]|uniref:LysR substrate-binding domain-containing protein n=1 Tax=Gallibacterium genomosp. 3 TaxID=505345 RepID=UPI0009F27D96